MALILVPAAIAVLLGNTSIVFGAQTEEKPSCVQNLLSRELTRLIPQPITPQIRVDAILANSRVPNSIRRLLAVENPESTTHYQRAIWDLRAQGFYEEAENLTADIEMALRSSEVVAQEAIGRGITDARLIRFSNGLIGVFKLGNHPANCANCEVAAYRLDRLLGTNLVPITVERTINSVRGSVQLYIPGSYVSGERFFARPSQAMRLLDYLMLNTDRENQGNYLYTTQGPFSERQVAIDHGLTFRTTSPAEVRAMLAKLRVSRPMRETLARITRAELFQVFGGLLSERAIIELDERRLELLDYLRLR